MDYLSLFHTKSLNWYNTKVYSESHPTSKNNLSEHCGCLYVVATPIGNLEDVSYRSLQTFTNVSYILSENTSVTSKVLNRYNIKAKQKAYRDENKDKIIPEVLIDLEQGLNVALVSDSGTPLISDPGFKLVSAAAKAGIAIKTIPGPSAVISALSISGLPTDKFVFVGFLPKKGGGREETIKKYGSLDATLVLYESPFRVLKTLEDIKKLLGNRFIAVAKELTKLHETVFYGKVDELLKTLPKGNLKGEFVIMVAKEDFS